jgi:hypothetical protein
VYYNKKNEKQRKRGNFPMQENGAAPRDQHSDAGYCRNLRRIEKPASVQFKEKF